MELVEDGDGRLSVLLAGHPKLRNDLHRPTMEEVGYRTDIFSLDGIAGSQREYIHWLLETCREGKVDIQSIITEEAIDLLATKLRTSLQIQLHLSLSLEAATASRILWIHSTPGPVKSKHCSATCSMLLEPLSYATKCWQRVADLT